MLRSRITFLFFISLLASAAAQAAVEGSFHRTLSVNGTVDLDVTTGSGNITVRTGNSGTVDVTGHIRASGWFDGAEDKVKQIQNNPPVQQSGNSIRIGHLQGMDFRHNVSISYELIVPADTKLNSHSGSGAQSIDGVNGLLEVEAGSGEIRVSNVGNTVRAETGSGDLRLQNIKGNVRAKAGSGSIRAIEIAGGIEGETGSGHIELEQSAPGAVRVKTGSGGIEVRKVRGSLEARAGSGGISADGEPLGGWIVHTGSGSVRLRLSDDAAFDLNAHTSSGSISLNRPVTVQGIIGRKEVRGKVRGGGPQIEVETSSGNIEIL